MAAQLTPPGYYVELRRRAREATRAALWERVKWRVSLLVATAVVAVVWALLSDPQEGAIGIILEALGVGFLALLLVCLVYWLWNLITAPAALDRERQEEIAALQRKLSPAHIEFQVRGPELFQPAGQAFWLFKLIIKSQDERPISTMVRLRLKIFAGQYLRIDPETSPINFWERMRSSSPGGLPTPLRFPLDIGPGDSADGCVIFYLSDFAKLSLSRKDLIECTLQSEDLQTRGRDDFWRSSVSKVLLGDLSPGANS